MLLEAVGGKPRKRLGQELHDLGLSHDADVEVGDKRQRATAFEGAGSEDDRPGLGDRCGAAGERAVEGIELESGQAVVGDELDVCVPPVRPGRPEG